MDSAMIDMIDFSIHRLLNFTAKKSTKIIMMAMIKKPNEVLPNHCPINIAQPIERNKNTNNTNASMRIQEVNFDTTKATFSPVFRTNKSHFASTYSVIFSTKVFASFLKSIQCSLKLLLVG